MRALLVWLVLLAGCATTYPSGRSLTVSHGVAWFGSAMDEATAYCEKMGMAPKHLGSERSGPGRMLSRFECAQE